MPAGHHPDSHQQLTEKQRPTHAHDSQHSALSTPVPQSQNLIQLSIILSSIRAAMQGRQSAWAQQIGADHVAKLMNELAKQRVVVADINELVDAACR